ncbi:MAG: hypothetical protein IKH30_04985, partial [Clostridia bacterium]|nr:hypothetical protein [Clostridia bacterium]
IVSFPAFIKPILSKSPFSEQEKYGIIDKLSHQKQEAEEKQNENPDRQRRFFFSQIPAGGYAG